MKASDNILCHHPVNTAPLLRYVERLCFILMGLVERDCHRKAVTAAQGIYFAVREMCRLELANEQRRLKLDMLSHKYWRRQVLRELGGERALARWNAAEARATLQRFGLDIAPIKTRVKTHPIKHQSPDEKPTQHSLILKESCRMDFEGEFRLPPLPRFSRKAVPAKITSPRAQPRPKPHAPIMAAPIKVWPAEFHAAEAWDYACWLRKHNMNDRPIRVEKVKAAPKTNPLEAVLQHVPLHVSLHVPLHMSAPLRLLLGAKLHQDRAYEAAT